MVERLVGGGMVLFKNPEFLEVRFDGNKGYVIFDWTDFSIPLREIKKAHEAAFEAARANECRFYVAECSKARDSLLPEVIAWWRSAWVPLLASLGVRIVSVEPRSSLASLSSRDWQRETESGLQITQVASLEEAEELIGRLRAGS